MNQWNFIKHYQWCIGWYFGVDDDLIQHPSRQNLHLSLSLSLSLPIPVSSFLHCPFLFHWSRVTYTIFVTKVIRSTMTHFEMLINYHHHMYIFMYICIYIYLYVSILPWYYLKKLLKKKKKVIVHRLISSIVSIRRLFANTLKEKKILHFMNFFLLLHLLEAWRRQCSCFCAYETN